MMQHARPNGARGDGRGTICETLLLLLRERVASRYYDRPEVIDALARVIAREGALTQS